MRTNNPIRQTKAILGTLACLVLFGLFAMVKHAPGAPWPTMPNWILTLPLWLPVALFFIYVGFLILQALAEREYTTKDEKQQLD